MSISSAMPISPARERFSVLLPSSPNAPRSMWGREMRSTRDVKKRLDKRTMHKSKPKTENDENVVQTVAQRNESFKTIAKEYASKPLYTGRINFNYVNSKWVWLFGEDDIEKREVIKRPPLFELTSNRPHRILDAPKFFDDYYSQQLSWSSLGWIAITLGSGIYCWNQKTLKTTEFKSPGDPVPSSLVWTKDGLHLLTGTTLGDVSLYDAVTKKVVSSWDHSELAGPQGKITAIEPMGTNGAFVGSYMGGLSRLDFRVKNRPVAQMREADAICKIALSPESRYLAVGGNDNTAKIWDVRVASTVKLFQSVPGLTSGVRALEWLQDNTSGMVPSRLLVGGGTNDQKIRLYDTALGKVIDTVNTGSQVTNIHAYSKDEFISTHGFNGNKIIRWKKLPKSDTRKSQLFPVQEFEPPKGRILSSDINPEKTTLVTASVDETIRMFDISHFPKRETPKKEPDFGTTGIR
jgi:cell division cycle 20-like protein 1, cofactor of APC complex